AREGRREADGDVQRGLRRARARRRRLLRDLGQGREVPLGLLLGPGAGKSFLFPARSRDLSGVSSRGDFEGRPQRGALEREANMTGLLFLLSGIWFQEGKAPEFTKFEFIRERIGHKVLVEGTLVNTAGVELA